MPDASPSPPARLPATSRYELLTKIASGGMATVYVGRLRGAAGFWRLVAIKRAHAHLVEDESFRRMLIAEARLASRIHHPNVVAVDDVEELASGELRLIMDYVEGASLSMLMSAAARTNQPLPPRLAMRIGLDACAGLHAAHQLSDDHGESLRLVHRDVSPHNILVGVDGTARLADFGIAKVARSSVSTTTGAIKGKLGYMAPEYIEGSEPDARSDVFALGAVIWEALAHRKLFRGTNEVDTLKRVVTAEVPSLAEVDPALGRALDGVLRKALAKLPAQRFQSAQELGAALEAAALAAGLMGSHGEVAAGVESLVGPALAERRREIRARSAPEEAPAPSAPTETLRQDPPAVAAASPSPSASASASAPPSSAITEALPPRAAGGPPPSMSSAATLQREERDLSDEPTQARCARGHRAHGRCRARRRSPGVRAWRPRTGAAHTAASLATGERAAQRAATEHAAERAAHAPGERAAARERAPLAGRQRGDIEAGHRRGAGDQRRRRPAPRQRCVVDRRRCGGVRGGGAGGRAGRESRARQRPAAGAWWCRHHRARRGAAQRGERGLERAPGQRRNGRRRAAAPPRRAPALPPPPPRSRARLRRSPPLGPRSRPPRHRARRRRPTRTRRTGRPC
ncbi:MAG: serine/threonine-protein kinase [Polyangiaceae bacterium]